MKENFYHGVLLGILGVKNRWGISSNREMGEGYADILVEPDTGDMGIIIEVKYAHDGDLDGACKAALKQIKYTRYEDDLSDDGVENILKYGIACYKKRCKIMLGQWPLPALYLIYRSWNYGKAYEQESQMINNKKVHVFGLVK